MLVPDEKVLRSLVNLEASQDFLAVMEWVCGSYSDQMDENNTLFDETRLRWGQGRAQLLSELIKEVKGARNTLLKRK